MLRIGVLVSGGGTNLQAVIDEIKKGTINGEIVGVMSSNSKAYALERAAANGIAHTYISKKNYNSFEAYEQAMIDYFKKLEVDLVLAAGFLVVLGERFVDEFKGKIINVHPSLIPSFCGKGYYGIKVHEAVLAAGVKVTGATVHFVDKGVDTGRILFQKAVEVLDDDTAETLQRRVMEEAERPLLTKAIRLYCEGKLRAEGTE